ncbi:hypothetical protein ACL2XO_17270 [Sodalis sp. RH15]|uniref:hypothetical protein n=1 Tax=Sodalis sp. RH15 TaxID=3394330 RepID=UPI0039B6763C
MAIIVPCHRVIAGNGDTHGAYIASAGCSNMSGQWRLSPKSRIPPCCRDFDLDGNHCRRPIATCVPAGHQVSIQSGRGLAPLAHSGCLVFVATIQPMKFIRKNQSSCE